MITTSIVLFSTLFATLASASPHPLRSSLTYRAGDESVCGTTQDADLAACQGIIDSWPGELVWSNECHFGGFWRGDNTAYNVASVPGCSIYVAGPGKETLAVKEAAQRLLGCADTEAGKVNGVTTLNDDTFVCIGGNDACGDCFDDTDINDLQDRKREASELEKRGRGSINDYAEILSGAINAAAGDDATKRANGVRNMVDGMAKEFNKNVVCSHVEHEAKFDGVEGVDWVHVHFEIDIALGGTIGYELYTANSGTFKRIGDGGGINWGWNAVLAKDAEEDGSFLTFTSRV